MSDATTDDGKHPQQDDDDDYDDDANDNGRRRRYKIPTSFIYVNCTAIYLSIFISIATLEYFHLQVNNALLTCI